jgi:hypothetical protein
VVRTFADIEELVGAAMEVERVLAEFGDTIRVSSRGTRRRNIGEQCGTIGYCIE